MVGNDVRYKHGTYHREAGLAVESGVGYVVHLDTGWQLAVNPECRTDVVGTVKDAKAAIDAAVPWPDDPDFPENLKREAE